MKGRKASAIPIRGCSQLKLKTKTKTKTKKKETEVCGLWSVPDDVFVDCLAQVSRLDLVALAMVSKRHRNVAASHELRAMRFQRDSVEPYVYVCLHMYPDPSPRWFVLHPVQRRLKPIHPKIHSHLYPAPVQGSCFVKTDWGIYTIGGLNKGKPTSEVTFLDCTEHIVYRLAPMKMARSGASAGLIDGKKIYVFGGCIGNSNWAEVYDIETSTWELLSVFTPKMPLKIQQSVVMDEKQVLAVDEDGQLFVFSTSESMFTAYGGRRESNPENRHDWLLALHTFFCRGVGGKLLWRLPREFDWKEVKGLEELQQQHPGFEIIKLCIYSVERMAFFWEARPQGLLELWYAEITLTMHECEVWELWGNIECSGPVLSDSDSSYTGLNLLCAYSLFL